MLFYVEIILIINSRLHMVDVYYSVRSADGGSINGDIRTF